MSGAAATGAELLWRGLADAGVTHAFGLPGSQTLRLVEGLRRSQLRTVLATHELAAAFMANGHYRASARPAALFTIPGPGFAFALAGLAEARDDSAALVHVVTRPPAGRPHEFQAFDQRAVAAPLVKGIVLIDRADEARSKAAEAVAMAVGGEPGPVLLDCAEAALAGVAQVGEPAPERRPVPADPALLAEAASLLRRARRPLLLLGQGAAGAAGAARRLAEALGAPVLTTASGRGVLPEDHPLALGFDFARGGADALEELLGLADCVLVVGCKLGAAGTGIWTLRLPSDRLVRIDASAEVLAANHPARLAIRAASEEALGVLAPALEASDGNAPSGWPAGEVARWRERLRTCQPEDHPELAVHGVSPPRSAGLMGALRRALPRDGLVVTDSGAHQDAVRRHFEVLTPRGLILPADFQSMGFGLPAALGAKLAAPERAVVAVVGDGGLAMTGLELLTAAREELGVAVVVFNDGHLNRIRLGQLGAYGRTLAVDLRNPDFEAFAASVGAGYELVDGDPEGALRRALASRGPTLVEVRVGDSLSVHLRRGLGLARGAARRSGGLLARLRRVLFPGVEIP